MKYIHPLNPPKTTISLTLNEDFVARNRYLGQEWVIAFYRILWDESTYPSPQIKIKHNITVNIFYDTVKPLYEGFHCMYCTQGLYSLSVRTSYRQNSWSLGVAGLDGMMIVSLWNLTGSSAALLPRWLSNFRAIGKVETRISRLWDFPRSCSNYVRPPVYSGPGTV